jgi:hypothetical protein
MHPRVEAVGAARTALLDHAEQSVRVRRNHADCLAHVEAAAELISA